MPCWYWDKAQLRETPSAKDGVDYETERRYRREGARFIMETGNKMGLRYNTSATGVVFFNRFFMFQSFKEFNRYVTASCCLFLAGKVEETPKKCKDIIKVARSLLSEQHFQAFKEDPKEEVMTMERILLQTIKFDLMLEHPYAFLLKYGKLIKGDKAKKQKVVQLAWTFVNDSLCTTLCLQWEPEIIAVALIYLAGRLTKFDISDWEGKPPGFRGKWFEFLVEDINLELMEDICHQVLDLYSSAAPQGVSAEDSPPPPPPKPAGVPGPPQGQRKRSHSPGGERSHPGKVNKDNHSRSASPSQGHLKDKQKKQPATAAPAPSTTYNPYSFPPGFPPPPQEGAAGIQPPLPGAPGYSQPPPPIPPLPPQSGGYPTPPAAPGSFPYPPPTYTQPPPTTGQYSAPQYPPGSFPQGTYPPAPAGSYPYPPQTSGTSGYTQPPPSYPSSAPGTFPPYPQSSQYPASTTQPATPLTQSYHPPAPSAGTPHKRSKQTRSNLTSLT